MTNRLSPAEMKRNVDLAVARAKAVAADPDATSEPAAFRRSLMARLRQSANWLHAAMATVADNDVEFTKVYGTVVRNEAGWDQLMLDLEALAGLARMEE